MAEPNESFVLIIDNSSSAKAGLDEARQTAQQICYMTGSEQIRLFMLDSSDQVPPASLKQATPPGVNPRNQSCSLITPIMKGLPEENRKDLVIIIGNGEIFDLDDWTGDPRFEGWLLVRTGDESLQHSSGNISEIVVEQIAWNDPDVLVSYFTRIKREPAQTTSAYDRSGKHQWRIDESGYPLIFVEPLNAYVQLFPVTKPQFERFMWHERGRHLGDDWYSEILNLNPRVSYRDPNIQSREHLFMTGITTDEAISFGHWMGREYELLTANDWLTCYEWFGEHRAMLPPAELAPSLSTDALAIWNLINEQWVGSNGDATLQDLSLMTRGILEWVVERPGKYCGVGEPVSAYFQRKPNDPVYPLGPEPRRLKNLGFRLQVRES